MQARDHECADAFVEITTAHRILSECIPKIRVSPRFPRSETVTALTTFEQSQCYPSALAMGALEVVERRFAACECVFRLECGDELGQHRALGGERIFK